MSQAPLLFEPGPALVVQGTLMREQSFFPTRKENGVEFESLGGMQRHDRHRLAFAVVGIHDQRDVLEEAGEILELLHRADQLFEVFETPGGIGAAVLLPHLGIAALVEHDLGELGVGQNILLRSPALERGEHIAQ